eukprot:m.164867 g.164867  ORF g.164867 m.164867 type:complete len:89 (-) comp14662_c1_seq1:1182-1448(-)
MKIAVEGCCHGELDNIYQTLADAEAANGFKVDLLICCGDFQAVRNLDDLQTMACPDKSVCVDSSACRLPSHQCATYKDMRFVIAGIDP